MKEIISYNVVAAKDAAELATKVNDQIKIGWQPFGNIFILQEVNDSRAPRIKTRFFQPIVIFK